MSIFVLGIVWDRPSAHIGALVDVVAVEPTRRRLVTASSDGTIRVWSLDSNQCLGVYALGGDTVGGLLLHGSSIYATGRGELLEIPWPD